MRGPRLQRQSGVSAWSCRSNVGEAGTEECRFGGAGVTPFRVRTRPRARQVESTVLARKSPRPKMSHGPSTLAPSEPGWATPAGRLEHQPETVLGASNPEHVPRRGCRLPAPMGVGLTCRLRVAAPGHRWRVATARPWCFHRVCPSIDRVVPTGEDHRIRRETSTLMRVDVGCKGVRGWWRVRAGRAPLRSRRRGPLRRSGSTWPRAR